MDKKQEQRSLELDGIRGIAILLIIFWHYGNNLLTDNASLLAEYVKATTSYFWSGVDLFFVLSGFLLGGILLKNKTSENYFKAFYTRRICRIFPIYFLALFIVYVICHFQIGQTTTWSFDAQIPYWSYLTFTQNIFIGLKATLGNRWISHTWSLALEEQFYLLLPLLIYLLDRKKLFLVLSTCVLAAPFFRHYSANWYEAFNFLYCRFDALFSGVLVAMALQNEGIVVWLRKNKRMIFYTFNMLLITSILLSFKILAISYNLQNSWFALLYSMLLLTIMTNPTNFLSGLLRNPVLVKTGVISYGMYLYHPLLLGFMHFMLKAQAPILNSWMDLATTLLSFVFTVLFSLFSYYFFEKRWINYGHRFSYFDLSSKP